MLVFEYSIVIGQKKKHKNYKTKQWKLYKNQGTSETNECWHNENKNTSIIGLAFMFFFDSSYDFSFVQLNTH